MDDSSKDFSFVKANICEELKIEKTIDFKSWYLQVPSSLTDRNLFIQVTSGTNTKKLTYFPTLMDIYLISEFGQVKVTDLNGKPLSKVYVKCFKKIKEFGGKTSFHKDGYTDLRGNFDYASLNTEEDLKDINMFSLLMIGEGYGAVIKEANPPKAIGEKKVEARQLKSDKWAKKQNMNNNAKGGKYQ